MLALLALLFACLHTGGIEAIDDAPITGIDNDPLGPVSVPARPLWMDKYSDTEAEMGRFFRIEALMKAHDLTRLQAVELQNHFRDLQRNEPASSELAHFDEALRRVEAGAFESGLDPGRLDNARFIVVFDLDDTLYDQYYPADVAESCNTVAFEQGDRTKFIQMTPGWSRVLETVDELGGVSVIFSANVDEPTLDNLSRIELGETSLLDSPLIAGAMTNSFLVLQPKSDGRPVIEPSKDLRVVDESLTRVIIVDDNPTRIFQPANTRVFRKFHADVWCQQPEDSPARKSYDKALPSVEVELRQAVAWMDELGVDFATAYLPFTHTGSIVAQSLVDGNGWSIEEASRYVVEHPEEADRKF